MLLKKTVAWILSTMLLQFSIAQQTQIVRPDGIILTHAAIDSLVKKLMDTARVTGLAMGILTDNQVNYIKSYGCKNKTTNLPNDTATSFYGASLAKPLFGYIVLQLVDSGLINLDKPLYTYLPKPLPEYENYRDLSGDDRWKFITARNCLDHTTGFPNWRQFNPKGNGKLELFFTPGERYAYSGEGIYLLQFVVEIITGRNLEELAREKIFVPFGMYKTSFLWQPSFETDYAVPHDENGNPLPKSKRTKLNAAGSMETTIADYSRFMSAVMQSNRLSVQSKTEMLTPQISIYSTHQFPTLNNNTTNKNKKIRLSYGLGWGLFFSPYGWAFFKEGHDEGWGHYTIQFPDKGFSLIIMSNSSNGERIFKELVEKITGVTIPWEWEGYAPYH